MRIIAGKHRGRRFMPPADEQTTRPITDRVKENLFNRLQALGMLAPGEVHHVLDLFAGTGSLGLEALSRGAEHCTFVEQDRDAATRLEHNVAELGEAERATVNHGSVHSPIWPVRVADGAVTLAFLDPPYAVSADDRERVRLRALLETLRPKLEPAGVVVLRTERHTDPLPVGASAYDGPTTVHYGSQSLHFYQAPFED